MRNSTLSRNPCFLRWERSWAPRRKKPRHQSGDPDHEFPALLAGGVPLGVTSPTLTSPGVWPLKSELSGEDPAPEDLATPIGRANYSSAKDFASHIRKTFVEEEAMDMVIGPLTRTQAAEHCHCSEEDLCPGPLAAIDEGDKIRTIYDGSFGGANKHIQNNTTERTTAPTVLDCVHALHWLHEASSSPPPPSGAAGPVRGVGVTEQWSWPPPATQWVLLKADVAKAHRRVKVLPNDWRFQVAELDGEWWVNKVGTYGMASAQLYWGRAAALILRLLYALFPFVDWGFVFVDDFCWLLRAPSSELVATGLMITLLALGIPLSWKKTHLAEINTWLGFVVHPNIPQVQMAAPKHVIVMSLPDKLIQNEVFSAKDIERALGRIQWATAVCPLTKSLMQPFWAWKMAVTTSGKPPKTVRLLALLLRRLFQVPYKQLGHPFSPSPHGGVAVMPVPPKMEIPLWEDGLVTSNPLLRTRSCGSISRLLRSNFHGPSRKATPRRGSQPLNSQALWFFADFFWPNRSRDPPVLDFLLEVTTKAMSFPSLALHPRNRTPQLFWWNSCGSCIWRAALWPRAMFLVNSTNGRMSSHISTTVASLTSSASMWERPCLTSFCFPV